MATRLSDYTGKFKSFSMFAEKASIRNGVITKNENPTFIPQNIDDLIVSGPHFYVGTPVNKSSRTGYVNSSHYDEVDLTEISSDFIQRALYSPGDSHDNRLQYEQAIPRWPQEDDGKKVCEYYRYANRKMAQPDDQRTLVPAILPKGSTHIVSVYSIAFLSKTFLLIFNAFYGSH